MLCIRICNIYLRVEPKKYRALYKLLHCFFLSVQVLANVVRQYVKKAQQSVLLY